MQQNYKLGWVIEYKLSNSKDTNSTALEIVKFLLLIINDDIKMH